MMLVSTPDIVLYYCLLSLHVKDEMTCSISKCIC